MNYNMHIWSSSSNLTQNICRKPSTEPPHSERTLPNSKMHPNNVSFSLISTLDPAYIREPKINKSTPFIHPKKPFSDHLCDNNLHSYSTNEHDNVLHAFPTFFCYNVPCEKCSPDDLETGRLTCVPCAPSWTTETEAEASLKTESSPENRGAWGKQLRSFGERKYRRRGISIKWICSWKWFQKKFCCLNNIK